MAILSRFDEISFCDCGKMLCGVNQDEQSYKQGVTMLTESEKTFIREAKTFLETDSVLMSLANRIGRPLDSVLQKLPAGVEGKLSTAVDSALKKSLDLAIKSTPPTTQYSWEESLQKSALHRHAHTGLTTVSGAIGGFFGIFGAMAELPVSTTLIMRNIVYVAKDFNFDPADPETALQCMYVLTLGSKKDNDDELDSAYYTARLGFVMAMNNARNVIKGVGATVAPQVAKFLNLVAKQFGTSVTEKMLAEAVPVLGAVGGAGINALFTDYFGKAARYHFGMLALEKRYGAEEVERIYKSIL